MSAIERPGLDDLAVAERGDAPSTRRAEPINILIVDDEPRNLTVLETVLADPSYRLVRAESADQALLALVADEFALLILDVRMPSMTGFQLAELIRARKKTSQVPIVFLTAHDNEDQQVLEGYGTGAVDYLHKPVNASILRAKVAVFAQLHRTIRERGAVSAALLAEVLERRRVEEELRALNETLDQRVMQRTEALRVADLRKDEFVAMLGHELRNPLAAIRTGVELLVARGPTRTALERGRDLVERQVDHMVRLVDDLLDISRVSSGRISLQNATLDLAAVARQAIEMSQTLIDARGHELIVSLPAEPVCVEGDFTRLTQVLNNLLGNAAKYADGPGTIWLTVERASGRAEGSADAVVRVRDSGRGMDAPLLKDLFDLFYQAERSADRTEGGLGIGLTLVKRLVEMHGGWVEARSAGRGMGSEFIVGLPLSQATPPVADRLDVSTPIPHRVRHRVLVVDDNHDEADGMTELLRIDGHDQLRLLAGPALHQLAKPNLHVLAQRRSRTNVRVNHAQRLFHL